MSSIQKTCAWCQAEFTARRKDAVYCGLDCKAQGRYARRYTPVAIGIGNCLWCNTEFNRNGTQRKYCSDKCRSSYRNKVTSEQCGRNVSGKTLRCEKCGVGFVATHGQQKFCSPLCREQNNHLAAKQRERYEKYKAVNADRLPALQKSRRLNYLYKLTPEAYIELVREQGGVCAICGKTGTGKSALCVDHNHTTGAVRGLLCNKCNSGLGQFDDDIEMLMRALLYLLKGGDVNADV